MLSHYIHMHIHVHIQYTETMNPCELPHFIQNQKQALIFDDLLPPNLKLALVLCVWFVPLNFGPDDFFQ